MGASENPMRVGRSTDFEKLMRKGVDRVNNSLNDADVEAKKLLSGKSGNLHEVMIGLEKADVSFKFMMKVRNKVVQAYQEVMRMNV